MVAPTASTSTKAFANDEDFISFDFADEAEEEASQDELTAIAPPPPPPTTSTTRQANGKKRKLDERDDGLSKKDRVRQAARATPWSVDVDWDRCWNAAEM